MARWEVNRPGAVRPWSSTSISAALAPVLNRGFVLRWGAPAAAGTLLGVYILELYANAGPFMYPLLTAAMAALVAVAIGKVRLLFLGLILLDFPFQWDIYLSYQTDSGEHGAIGGLGISLTTLSLAALYLVWFAELLTKPNAGYSRWFRASLPLILYVGIAALSMLVALDRGMAFFEVFLLVQTLLLFVYIVSTVRTRREVLFVATMLVVGLALESLVMLIISLVAPGFKVPFTTGATSTVNQDAGSFRAVGTFGSPNVAGGYLSLLLAPTLALFLARAGNGRRILALVAFALGGLALTFTFSRGGWGAATISLAIFCFFAWQRGWLSLGIPVGIAGAASMLFAFNQDLIVRRIWDAEAAQGRLPLVTLATRMVSDHPILGVGANNFYPALANYLTGEFVGDWLFVVHNKYLLVLAETGVLGLGAFIAFLAITIDRGWRVWRRGDRLLSILALGFTSAMIGQMFHMMVDIFNARPAVEGLWLAAALITAMANLERDDGSG